MEVEFFKLFRETWGDLQQADVIRQVSVLAVCLLLAALVARRVRGQAQTATDNRALQLGSGGVRRIAFPLTALALVFVARALVAPLMHVNLLNLAVPLLISLAAVRVCIYVLRQAFAPSGWLAASERVIATLVWGGFALYLTGLSTPLIEALEAVSFSVGKAKLDLWMIAHGAVMVFVTVLGALWVAGLIERRLEATVALDSSVRAVLSRVAKAVLAMLAVLFSLPAVGIDLTALSVFGGALGVGLGLGLQKIASNYVSGFIILLDRSIRIGNVINVGTNTAGVVTRITTRYTVVAAPNGTEAIVPNEFLVSNIVHNQSYTDSRVRLATQVRVAYDTDLPQAMDLLQTVAAAHRRVLPEPKPGVSMTAFADSGIDLELGFWIADPEAGTGGVRSEINVEIWRAFRAAGIRIPLSDHEARVPGPQP